jgi:ESCRT-II complex subunit VPS36
MADPFQRFWQELPVPPGTTRPSLSEYEVECLLRDKVALVDGRSNRVVHQGGMVILTSHRIIWHCHTQSRAYQGHLSKVADARKSRNFFKPSSRVYLYLQGPDQHGDEPATKIDFVHGGRDEFLEQVKTLLQMRDWEKVPAPTPTSNPGSSPALSAAESVFTTRKAGVGGIIRQQENTRAAQDKLAAEAFGDLQALMSKAREVVSVIERYATVLASKATGEGADAGSGDGEEDAELQGLLIDMGISNPVTRVSAGSLYHQELARQLAQFLTGGGKNSGKTTGGMLAARGGMMTLHDTFCLFNRARGTALISPEDLLDACKVLESLQLGMRLRRFPSGVSVVEAQDFSEQQVSERLRALAEGEADGSLTALDVATHLRVSLTLAQEFLRTAEARGQLCRDESVQGTLFWPNRFPDFVKSFCQEAGAAR